MSAAFVWSGASLKLGWFFAISWIRLSVSFGSIFTKYWSNFIFSIDFISTLGSSVTEIIYSSSLSSPYVLRSNFGWPAGFILFSSKAFVDVSFITLSRTSLKTALPNCLLRIYLMIIVTGLSFLL